MHQDQRLSTVILLNLYHYSAYANRLALAKLVKLDKAAAFIPTLDPILFFASESGQEWPAVE